MALVLKINLVITTEILVYLKRFYLQILFNKMIGIFVGPEGGFADMEAKELQEIGAKTMSLGHRILRTETAGMTVMSILSFMLDK